MKKYVNPIVMVLIGVLICVLAEEMDQRTVVKKKNVKIDQSKLTYDEAEQYRRSLPDREPDNNNLVALKTNLLPYGLPGRQKGWYGSCSRGICFWRMWHFRHWCAGVPAFV